MYNDNKCVEQEFIIVILARSKKRLNPCHIKLIYLNTNYISPYILRNCHELDIATLYYAVLFDSIKCRGIHNK